MIPVGGTNGWSQGQDYFPLRLLINDRLNFTFSSPNTVHLMANKVRITASFFLAVCLFEKQTKFALI